MNMTPALNFYLAREHDKALEELQKVLQMEPNFVAARSVMGNVLVLFIPDTGRAAPHRAK